MCSLIGRGWQCHIHWNLRVVIMPTLPSLAAPVTTKLASWQLLFFSLRVSTKLSKFNVTKMPPSRAVITLKEVDSCRSGGAHGRVHMSALVVCYFIISALSMENCAECRLQSWTRDRDTTQNAPHGNYACATRFQSTQNKPTAYPHIRPTTKWLLIILCIHVSSLWIHFWKFENMS